MVLTLPYARLNLRRNPFGELEPEERAELAVTGVEGLAERLRRPGVAVQLLGDSGCGKTTHLLALRRRFLDAPFVKVIQGVRTRVPAGYPVFVDDAHLLPPAQRLRLFRRSASFVLTTHRDLSAELERRGLEPVVVRPAETLDAQRLERLVHLRIEAARRGPGRVPRVPRAAVEELLRRHGDDVRSMEQVLYGAFVDLKECGDVEL